MRSNNVNLKPFQIMPHGIDIKHATNYNLTGNYIYIGLHNTL